MGSTKNQRDEWGKWGGRDAQDEWGARPGRGVAGAPVPAEAVPVEVSGETVPPPSPPPPPLSSEREPGAEPGTSSGPAVVGRVDLVKVHAPEPRADTVEVRAPEPRADTDTEADVCDPAGQSTVTGGDGQADARADAGMDLLLDLDLDVVDAVAAVGRGTGTAVGPLDLGAAVAPLELGAGLPDGGARASAAVSVGAGEAAPWRAGRRYPVIANETTAPIPVHLLFRDEGGHDAGNGTVGDRRTGPGVPEWRPAARRPPMPRSPRAERPMRPAPPPDPRLTERPGPVLPGWSALLAAAIAIAAGLGLLGWHGVLPATVTARLGMGGRPHDGLGIDVWAPLALLAVVVLFALGGLGRGRVGYASVLTLFGDYRGSVRRTGLLWVSPLLLRRRVDVRLRHWRSEPLPAVDASGTALRVVVLVVWRVTDTVRATLGIADHEQYLRDQVEAALARVLSQLPADAFLEETRTLRDAEAVGDALTRMLKAECAPAGVEIYSAQPTGIEYAPEVAAAMQRCRVAAIDAKHRDGVLTSVVDAVDDTVGRLTARGIVELDDYEHKALVRDLTVAFYTGRGKGDGA
ncbi:SPFH domain-containing protein [Streptomyces clavifer]|uniref:SPFH domain-containing protein n=1 Tax=Streptomyces clavifer TaxID=68188 RepID=UPI00381A641D